MNPDRFILWTAKPERLNQPRALLTSGTLDDTRKWRLSNRWADNLPLICFGGSELPYGRAFYEADSLLGATGIPYRAANAPEAAWLAWKRPAPPQSADLDWDERMAAYVDFVRCCANHLPGPLWQLHADTDDGAIAIGIAASNHRRAVALSAAPSGLHAAAWAARYHVAITNRPTSGWVH
jgi:hypothetical protein